MKSTVVLSMLALLFVLPLSAQNITNTLGTGGVFRIKDSTNTYFTLSQSGGNVGIGTTKPLSKLHIISDENGGAPRLQSFGTTSFAAGWDFYHGATGKGYVGVPDATASIARGELLLFGSTGTKISLWPGSARSVTLDPNGNVGIGEGPVPNSRLVVSDAAAAHTAVYGANTGTGGIGVEGYSISGIGVSGFTTSGYAGYFTGNVHVIGTLSKTAGSFKIDHPLDPANKYLSHSFVESPDMMNIYNGNATLDSRGEAVIALPDWFEALNKEFRYQLTCIGAFAQVYVAEKVKDNRFKIAGGTTGLEVSWQVTGTRQDAYANAHRIPLEEMKPDKERGYYLHPGLFGQPEEKGAEWARRPEMMKEMKERREKAKAESQK